MRTLLTQNETLNKIASVLNEAKNDRATIINDVIALIVTEAKTNKSEFISKRACQKWIIENMLQNIEASEVNNYIKRALYVAKAVLVDGYNIKKEFLSLAQAEKAVRVEKGTINSLMTIDDEELYLIAIKDAIATAEKTKAVAELEKLGAWNLFKQIQHEMGDDAKKALNNMLKSL